MVDNYASRLDEALSLLKKSTARAAETREEAAQASAELHAHREAMALLVCEHKYGIKPGDEVDYHPDGWPASVVFVIDRISLSDNNGVILTGNPVGTPEGCSNRAWFKAEDTLSNSNPEGTP